MIKIILPITIQLDYSLEEIVFHRLDSSNVMFMLALHDVIHIFEPCLNSCANVKHTQHTGIVKAPSRQSP